MNDSPSRRGVRRWRDELAPLVRDMSYEIMPFTGTEDDVVEHVPTEVPLTVTVTEAKGVDATIELAARLRGRGYRVAPHLPARQFVDARHVADVVDRLRAADVDSVFVIGGDAAEPAGPFTDAVGLLQALEEVEHPFTDVGIGGYPEGHPAIPRETLTMALKQKAPYATRMLTQICFDAATTARWSADVAAAGVELPVKVGIPGPVGTQKLLRISANIGLGQSARFLRKQQSLLWRFLLPGAYDPTKLVRNLAVAAPATPNNIAGLHVFTFNELRKTELWRRELLAAMGVAGGEECR